MNIFLVIPEKDLVMMMSVMMMLAMINMTSLHYEFITFLFFWKILGKSVFLKREKSKEKVKIYTIKARAVKFKAD
jgi:hypothetical protein